VYTISARSGSLESRTSLRHESANNFAYDFGIEKNRLNQTNRTIRQAFGGKSCISRIHNIRTAGTVWRRSRVVGRRRTGLGGWSSTAVRDGKRCCVRAGASSCDRRVQLPGSRCPGRIRAVCSLRHVTKVSAEDVSSRTRHSVARFIVPCCELGQGTASIPCTSA